MALDADQTFSQSAEAGGIERGGHGGPKAADVVGMDAHHCVCRALERRHFWHSAVEAGQLHSEGFADFGSRQEAVDLRPEDLRHHRLAEEEVPDAEYVGLKGVVHFIWCRGLGQLKDMQGSLAVHGTKVLRGTGTEQGTPGP